MKIRYREAGGFAGLRRAAEVDLESMPPAEARRLRALVEQARLEPLERRGPSAARDLVGYEIAIEDDDHETVLARFDDATVPERAADLVDALRKRARPIPLGKAASAAPAGPPRRRKPGASRRRTVARRK